MILPNLRSPFLFLVALQLGGLKVNALAALLVSADFNQAPTNRFSATAEPATAMAVSKWLPVGTIDQFMGKPSGALILTVDLSKSQPNALAALSTGKFSVANSERELAKLSVGFDLCLNVITPVSVSIESYDQADKLTGSRQAIVVPPVAGSYYRFVLDLDQTVATSGQFDPLAPKIQFVFTLSDAIRSAPLPRQTGLQLKIDNLSYCSPAFYVSPHGDDRASGQSAAVPFATIQHAVDVAQPGDVILLLDGTYTNASRPDISAVPREIVNAAVWRPWWAEQTGGVCRVAKAGLPAAWIVIRNNPGDHPRLFNRTGWEAFKIDLGTAYVEIRGLTLQGNNRNLKLADAQADGSITERDGWRYYGDARYNGNGIMVDGRATQDPSRRAHHLRFIDNTVYDFPAGGIVAIGSDYVTTQGNTVYENVHSTRWGASGISYLRASNFDESTGHKMFVIGNRSFLNRCYVPWVQYESDKQGNPVANAKARPSPLSDGNGIIIDVNRRRGIASEGTADRDYVGRTLVSNNLSYGNGGGGIVLTTVQHVDVVNNTVYGNVQTPELVVRGWGDLMLGGPSPGSGDVTVINNVVFATVARAALWIHPLTKPQPILVTNNLFCGGADRADWGQRDTLTSDPLFANATLDPTLADFHLRSASPAWRAGTTEPSGLIPWRDLEENDRPPEPPPTLGAFARSAATQR